MKRILSVLVLAGAALTALPAVAAPVFMLQFGSFESRAEADEKLAALKSKHAGVLSRMEAGVRGVTLPPDNLTVYRTQAGPLATRADAQSVCSQLASNGDECYVVETAMLQPVQPPVAKADPAVTPPAPMPAPPAAEPEAAVKAPAPVPAPVAAEQTAPIAPRDSSQIAAMNRVMPSPPATVPDAQDSRAQGQPATGVSPDTNSDGSADRSMHRQLEEAARLQATGLPAPEPVAPKPPVKDRSLWERLFGGDEEEEPAAAQARTAEDAVQAAPVDTIAASTTPIPSPTVPVDAAAAVQVPAGVLPPVALPKAEATATAAAAAAVAVPAPAPAPAPEMAAPVPAPASAPVSQPVSQPVAIPAAAMVVEAQPYPLPPPPAPLVGMSRPVPTPQLSQTTNATVPAPLAVMEQPAAPLPPVLPAEAPQPIGSLPTASTSDTAVQVEEAKRVPLTSASIAPAAAAALPPPLPASAAASPTMPASLSPSATLGQKTLWAQIGPFPDQQSALAHWDQYRRTHPDFPVVRVRVTTPLMAQRRGLAQVNLRVGPFARQGFIRSLCGSLANDALKCGSITDMGVASGGGRSALPQSRYNR